MPIRRIALAILVAGTLDLLAAFWFASQGGWSPTRVLQFVASGPFGDAMMSDAKFAPLGVLVHFAIMSVMVIAYFALAPKFVWTRKHPILAGLAYGLVLWIVMYWIVRPLRWPSIAVSTDPTEIGGQWFCHLVLVGIPIALFCAASTTATRARVSSRNGPLPRRS